jgi:hypothetical protein
MLHDKRLLAQAAEQAVSRSTASEGQNDVLREQLHEVVKRGEALLAQVNSMREEKDELARVVKEKEKELKKAQEVRYTVLPAGRVCINQLM